ncbi:hypothetical protein BC938DRAFT_477987, partial [Jimgerdemannia flammicorona]
MNSVRRRVQGYWPDQAPRAKEEKDKVYYRSDDHITSVNPARKDVGTTDVERPKVPWRIKRKGRDALDAAKDERGWEKKWVHKQLVVVHFGGGRR